jgi:dipeptidyl-peptidase-4
VVEKYSYETGNAVAEILNLTRTTDAPIQSFDDYNFSSDEQKLLLTTETQQIYRHSFLAKYYVADLKSGSFIPLRSEGKQMHATFSPNAENVAYLVDNDLYIKNLVSGKEFRITKDGKKNYVINGSGDWVYEEEFVLVRAFEWSPDSRYIAWVKFDESKVPAFSMPLYGGRLYPENDEFKYPKVGEVNSIVSLYVYDTKTGKENKINIPGQFEYLPRIGWSPEGKLWFMVMNRLQNELKICTSDPEGKVVNLLYRETSPTYIELDRQDGLYFTASDEWIGISEKSGWFRICRFKTGASEPVVITSSNHEVTKIYGVDQNRKLLYFQATGEDPLTRYVYCVSTEGGDPVKLTPVKGNNDAEFSSDFSYFIHIHSDKNTPDSYVLRDFKGKEIRVLEDNKRLRDKIAALRILPASFFKIPAGEQTLNAWSILPQGFDIKKKYPVLMYVYGGPGSQTVLDDWGSMDYFWFQMLAQKGYIVVSVDGRGTGARGKEFRDCTYGQLGNLETRDQISAARWLAQQEYVDPTRIGIFGWSYGGYMSSLCITRGADIFKSAIAVAPVTNWKFYDNIYTERYMGTLQTNPAGFDKNAPISYAGELKGNYLLIHGTADDNVHWQNAAEMVNALISKKNQFEMFMYPDRNHGIYGGPTRFHLYTLMTDFILRKL